MRNNKAFTLIELLIVVAIIAILAAIAVPNFLEAQVRSKVSRAKADMRSLATGIESYYVDNNRYPIAAQWVGIITPNSFNNRLRGITTPIAYISSLPDDVFRNKQNDFPITANQTPSYEYTDVATAVPGLIDTYAINYNLFDTQESWDSFYTGRTGTGLKYILVSVGPDKTSDFQTITPLPITLTNPAPGALILGSQRTYDPTNGTVSTGDVVRTQANQRN